MPTHLFFQKFDGDALAPMPFRAAVDSLLAHGGKPGRGRFDPEFVFEPDKVAHRGVLIGDAQRGALCVALERPRFDDVLRDLAFQLLERLGCCLFDDALQTAYVLKGAPAAPAKLAAACVGGVRRISSRQQLWPHGIIEPPAAAETPALLYQNPNPNGPHYEMFDRADMAKKELYLELGHRAEACNPATLRVLRNVEQRVDAALSTNPDFKVFYRFATAEGGLQFMESPRLAQIANPVTVVTPFPGQEEDPAPFRADTEVFRKAGGAAQALIEHASGKLQLPLDGSAASLPALDRFLEQAQGIPAIAMATICGGYLGEVIRREVGAQWGSVRLTGHKYPTLRMHTGRHAWPALWALDRVLEGPGASAVDYFRELAENCKSATPRGEDIARDIPILCDILLGRSTFASGGLPLADRVPVASLDYSVASLQSLDRYLGEVHRQAGSFGNEALSNLALSAGCYLGEVIRLHAPGVWQWENHADFFRGREPGMPRGLESCVILNGPEKAVLPIAQIGRLIASGTQGEGTFAFARAWTGGAEPAPSPAAAPQPEPASPRMISTWPRDARMAQLLYQVRSSVVKGRQRARTTGFEAIFAAKPDWMGEDPLRFIIEKQSMLLQNGNVDWGALVQANSKLLAPGPDDLPAMMVHGAHEHFDGRPRALRRIARTLFGLKGTAPSMPVLRRMADLVTNEVGRVFRVPVPEVLSNQAAVVSTFMVFRKHLPEGVLRGGWFPVLTHPDTHLAMIVPFQWWTDELVKLWQGNELFEPDEGAKPAEPPPDDFGKLELKQFVSPGMGIVLAGPKSWNDSGDEKFFQVTEPDTGTALTASAYQNPGVTLEQWAELRFRAVAEGMTFLQCIRPPYAMIGTGWTGIASEYEGVFPTSPEKKRYLVLCIRTDTTTFSVSLTALHDVFEQKERLYRWLLQRKLELYKVQRV